MKSRVIESSSIATIAVADKPLRLGGVIEHISVQEAESRFGCPLAERIDATEVPLNPAEMTESVTGSLSAGKLRKKLTHLIAHPRQDLVICKMDEQVGYGVFASHAIPENTLLCFWSGKLRNTTRVNRENDHALGFVGQNMAFSTSEYRGLSSFFQHLPTPLKCPDPNQLCQLLQSTGQSVTVLDLMLNDELYALDFNQAAISASLATENVRCEHILYQDMPVIVMVTNTAIKPGDQLGFNYGKNYFLSRKIIPEYFDEDARVISSAAYRRTCYQLNFDGQTFTGDFSPLIQQLRQGVSTVSLVDDKQKRCSMDASVVLEELRRVRGISNEEYQALKLMPASVQSGFSLFQVSETTKLVNKYRLPDESQSSLEKGLRNAAANNAVDDLITFISLVKCIDAKDANPKTLRTALHWAVIKGHKACARLLIESGANPALKDATGTMAYTYIEQLFHRQGI